MLGQNFNHFNFVKIPSMLQHLVFLILYDLIVVQNTFITLTSIVLAPIKIYSMFFDSNNNSVFIKQEFYALRSLIVEEIVALIFYFEDLGTLL